ncbi:MAG TPA: hypothetical protein VFX10_05995 [Nitrospira sp.]|nr:hypothetical protein [Nitrospira sp.]
MTFLHSVDAQYPIARPSEQSSAIFSFLVFQNVKNGVPARFMLVNSIACMPLA